MKTSNPVVKDPFLRTTSTVMLVAAILIFAIAGLVILLASIMLAACFVEGATSIADIVGTYAGMVIGLEYVYGLASVILGTLMLVCAICGRKQTRPVLCIVFDCVVLAGSIVSAWLILEACLVLAIVAVLHLIATVLNIRQTKQAKLYEQMMDSNDSLGD